MKTPKNIPIYIIVTRADYNDFQYLSEQYHDINVNFIIFGNAITLINSIDVDDNNLLNQLGKSKYQSLKKVYGLLYLMMYKNMDNVIIFDSECMVIRDFDINTFINEYVVNPTYVYSSCSSGNNRCHTSVNNSTGILLKSIGLHDCIYNNIWMLEYYMWIYERHIFLNFIETLSLSKHTNLIEIMKPLGEVFIENIYFTYIYNHSEFGYKFINFLDQLKIAGASCSDISDMEHIVSPFKPLEDVRILIENGVHNKYIDNVYDDLKLAFYKTNNTNKSQDFITKHECIKICVSEYSDIIFKQIYPEFSTNSKNSFFRQFGFTKIDDNLYRLHKETDECLLFNWIGFEINKIIGMSYLISCDIVVTKKVVCNNDHMIFFKSHRPCIATPVTFDDLVPSEPKHYEFEHRATVESPDMIILIFDNSPSIDITIKNIKIIIRKSE